MPEIRDKDLENQKKICEEIISINGLMKDEINQNLVLIIENDGLYAKILNVKGTKNHYHIQRQSLILPLDGQRIKKEDIEHDFYKRLSDEDYQHQNELVKVAYKIIEKGLRCYARIDVQFQLSLENMKPQMVLDILDQLVDTTLNTELYGFHHAILGQSFSNDPFTISEVLNMSTLSNLWFLSPKNLENIDDH